MMRLNLVWRPVKKLGNATISTALVVAALVAMLTLAGKTQAQGDVCETKGSMLAPHYSGAAAVADGRLYVFGGHNGATDQGLEVYDPATDTWTKKPPMPTARGALVAGVFNSTPYAAGGQVWNGSITAVVEAYTAPAATCGFIATDSMSSPRIGLASARLNDGRVLVTGGTAGSTTLASAELYDSSTGTFAQTGGMSDGRVFHTATRLNSGKVLVAGGNPHGSNFGQASAELYDPTTGTFTPTANMTVPRVSQSETQLSDGRVLIAGGYNGAYLASAEVYNPATETFSPTGSLTTVRYGHSAALLGNGKVLIVGHPFNSPSAELYDPSTNAFTTTGNLNVDRFTPTTVALVDGCVLVVGGQNSNGDVASAEIYNPASGTFTITGSMTVPRNHPTATLLIDGRVLVAGGTGPGIGALQSADVYDPSTGTFTAIGNMSTPRSSHNAVLLTGGAVLIVGGTDGVSHLSSAELFSCTQPNTSPIASCQNVSVSAGPACAASASIDNGSFDPDDADTITISQSPPGPYPVGSTSVTLTVTDNHGASSECMATVTVVDSAPPIIGCPGSIAITAALGNSSTLVTYPPPTANDNCSIAMVACTPPSGSAFPLGTTTVICSATDASNNTANCSFSVTVSPPQLTALGSAKVWLGLKNSDDVGTKFDLLAEVFQNGALIGSGQLDGVSGGSSGFNNAVARLITLGAFGSFECSPGDTLSIRLSARIAVGVAGHRSGTARLWFNDSAADTGFDATIDGLSRSYYLTTGSVLSPGPGPGPRKTADVFVDRAVGGNPFKPFGTWSLTF